MGKPVSAKGTRDDRGRNARSSSAAEGKGELGPGYRGEKGTEGDTKARRLRADGSGTRGGTSANRGDRMASKMGDRGLAVEGIRNFGGYEPVHTSRTR
jgi:hypothetical protein